MKLPQTATLIEVGPRDGFQPETQNIPTELKVKMISGLVEAGLKHIQVTSFVHPRMVPQMADAEKVCSALPKKEDVEYSGLVLNVKGIDRALAAGIKAVDVSISASDTHSRKNANMPLEDARKNMTEMIRAAKSNGLTVRAGLMCVFGCNYEGEIPQERVLAMAEDVLALGVNMFGLADTTGRANPAQVERMLEKAAALVGDVPIALHFHDTRGMGLANVLTALSCGVTHFDVAFGGMGGCPFVPGATGNIPTEDTAYMLQEMGVETGIDIKAVADLSKEMEQFLDKRLSGKMYTLVE
ncbi:hydroxymethylglutaryl-CoA lyase [Thermodesulfobacteriota bacterium]